MREKLSDLNAYVLIDVSNIRASCLRSCGFRINFRNLAKYLKKKYPNLKIINYYEGIAKGDKKKEQEFKSLEKSGYTIKTLRRRSYTNPAVQKSFKCKKCQSQNRVKVLPKRPKMKSNVDVYLATEMLEIAFGANKPTHIVMFSCDGDYAEAIKVAAKNKNIRITVVATPPVNDLTKNTLSVRLKILRKELPKQYHLMNILDIKDEIT